MKLNTKFTAVIVAVTVVPIAIFTSILFHNMEQNVIDESISYMEYNGQRNEVQIEQNIDSINMSTQFFLSDDAMRDVLIHGISDEPMSTEELLQFYENDVADLERLVNNNPMLYCVRIFAKGHVQEMMPVLYEMERMEKLEWGMENRLEGWQFDYRDTTFSELLSSQTDTLISLVTPIEDFEYGVIGYIESAMLMKNMFPSFYEDIENEWSCFVSADGTIYFGDNEKEDSSELIQQLLKKQGSRVIDKNVMPETDSATVFLTIGEKQLVVSNIYIRELDGKFVMVQDITGEINEVRQMRNFFLIVIAVAILIVAILINHLVNRMLRQFYKILEAVRMVQKGDLDIRVEEGSNDEMGELSIQLNKMLDRIQKLMQDNINREVLVKNSEIRALQNQINAHFIYNVLESIKMMAEIDEEYEISDAITSLGKLLRYSMKWVSGNVLLREELEYIKNYMVLINLRFDYDIYLSINIPDELLEQEIPKMSLQPIVENAILHGIEQMAEDTNIYIKGMIEGDNCRIEITDAGNGMTPEEVEALRKKITGNVDTAGGNGHGIGLKNVQDRITMAFGNGYGLEIDSKQGCYTKVSMCLPRKNGRQELISKGEA